jgi:hypothetical protein
MAQGRRGDDHPPLEHQDDDEQDQALVDGNKGGHDPIDNPAARNWQLDVTCTNPMGSQNHESLNAPALAGEHKDPRNDVLTSAARAS